MIKRSYTDPMVVVVLAGMPGRGKSTTSTNLYRVEDPNKFPPTIYFACSTQQTSFTQGAWIASKPLTYKGIDIMLVDLQGLEQSPACYNLTIAGLLFSDVFNYMSSGDRVEDNIISILTAAIDAVHLNKLNITPPKLNFTLRDSGNNCNEPDGFFVNDLPATHDEFRADFARLNPKIVKFFGISNISFTTIRGPQRKVFGTDNRLILRTFNNTTDPYYEDLVAMLNVFHSAGTKGTLGGIDMKVEILEQSLKFLNSGEPAKIVRLMEDWLLNLVLAQAVSLQSIHGLALKVEVRYELDKANMNRMDTRQDGERVVRNRYPHYKQLYEQELRQYIDESKLSVAAEAKTRIAAEFPFPPMQEFLDFCSNVANLKELKLQQEQAKLINDALSSEKATLCKVRVSPLSPVCSKCGYKHNDGVGHKNCENSGRDGTYYWLLPGTKKEAVCNLCRKISTIGNLTCYRCSHPLLIEKIM